MTERIPPGVIHDVYGYLDASEDGARLGQIRDGLGRYDNADVVIALGVLIGRGKITRRRLSPADSRWLYEVVRE